MVGFMVGMLHQVDDFAGVAARMMAVFAVGAMIKVDGFAAATGPEVHEIWALLGRCRGMSWGSVYFGVETLLACCCLLVMMEF